MSFRIVNGSTYTENGWRCCNRDECDTVKIPELYLTETAPIRKGAPLVILGAWMCWYDRNIEEILTSIWGWSKDNDVIGGYGANMGSNHLSGTAIDLNAPMYPWGLFRMPADKIEKVREGLALFSINGESGIFWGRKWGEQGTSKADEMHYQMAWPEGDPRNDQLAQKLLDGYLGIYPKEGTSTPEISTVQSRKLVQPSPGGAFWNDVSQYQITPVNEDYPYKIFSFRTNSGDKTDALAKANAQAAKRMLDSGQLALVIPYYFFRPGQANCDLHKDILVDAGLFDDSRVVSMVDVEGDNATVVGDCSSEINDEVSRLQGWGKKVIGYYNSNADPGLWPTRNGIDLIVPQYNRTPGDISSVFNAQVRQDAIGHQFTSLAKDQKPWAGISVDVNWTPYEVPELLALFGIEEKSAEPPESKEENGLFMYLTKEEEFAIRDKILGYPQMGNKWPSRALFADEASGVDDTVGMLLNVDGNIWDVKVILFALCGSKIDIARIQRLADGKGPRGNDKGSVKIAKGLLQFIQPGDQND